ncbi:ATP-binding protein [Loktanella sp. SALINAS62]|uniref:sensor histidine kinase n=1 Tax=Loktanella sp. SALINAS62 TaxID=2706124 RepID=UPI001B8B371F|nr:ATP-binding protein [Loktanella sp. SALINAS62]MBS1302592.1 sensor histidine kinase [Loktanella sp. SALINAS62]
MNVYRQKVFVLTGALALTALLVGALTLPHLQQHYLREQAEDDTQLLHLAKQSLQAALERYAPLPALIAERPSLGQLLENPDTPALAATVNEDLRQTAAMVHASDVFLMDITGRTIAAATYQDDGSYVGRNFSHQTYFTNALYGALSSFQVSGTTTGERGYFYAAPVEVGDRIVGVLAIKFNIEAFNSVWNGASREFIVSDTNGFVLMSSRPDWHFRAMRPLTDATRRVIAQNLQYPIDRIELLPITTEDLSDTAQRVTITGDTTDSFVMTFVTLPQRGWTMTALQSTAPALLTAVTTLLMIGLIVLLLIAALLSYLLKQARQKEALISEQRAKRLLETTVSQRTADLQKALEHLKNTQTDLIQAGKLSGLGQMSAALSHEFNQPLAAVKTYADNARAFLDRDRVAEARDNIDRISKMADRMASISAHLRNFARRPQQATGPLLLNKVVHDALAVIDVRLASGAGRIDYTAPIDDVYVTGGHVRLQQVIVNMLNNALDAMEGQTDPLVTLTVSGHSIVVRDRGPGVDAATADQMFDPFFTTKPPGKGLGLGLSISYNIVTDFGGTMTAANHPDGGAVFTVTLQPATPLREAAE